MRAALPDSELRGVSGYNNGEESRALSARPTQVITVRLRPGAKGLHGPLGGLDSLGIVAEESLGRLAPTVTNLDGLRYDPCLAARLAGYVCGLSRRRRHNCTNANRTGYECHDEFPHGAPLVGHVLAYHMGGLGSRCVLVRALDERLRHQTAQA
jgi:hypothetical protein